MSQIYKPTTDSNLPPDVLTRIQVDVSQTLPLVPAFGGTVTPQANIIRATGDYGIVTKTDPAQAGVLDIEYNTGFVTTSDGAGQTQTLISFPIPVGTCLSFQVLVTGLDTVSNDGCGGYTTAFVKNIGGTASLVSVPQIVNSREGTVVTATFDTIVSANDFIIQVIGVAGRTINWGCCIPGISINTNGVVV